MAADALCTRAVLGVSLQLIVLVLLHSAWTAVGVCVVSSTKVTGCRACATVKQATVCTACSTGYAFKRSAKGSGGLCVACKDATKVPGCSKCAPSAGAVVCTACGAAYMIKRSTGGKAGGVCVLRACAQSPCKNGKGVATCRAKAGAPKGRTCTCNAGFAYKNDASGCLNVNACVKYPCTKGAGRPVCKDLPPPARNAAAGRTCTCNTGFTYKGEKLGCIAKNVDACLKNPCRNGNGTATCRDLPPPAPNSAKGRTCNCGAGFTYNEKSGCTVKSVKNVDACKKHPCRDGAGTAVCADLPPPAPDAATGRSCTCGPGFTYKDDRSGCVTGTTPKNIDACLQHPCRNGAGTATCIDLPPPAPDTAEGRTCTCNPAGYSYKDDVRGCTSDVDACTANPCTDGDGSASCRDKPPPATNGADGRTCSCNAGFTYIDDVSGCKDVNACEDNPCNDGSDTAVCKDLAAPAPNSAGGRKCSCSRGFSYANDTDGCVDADACASFPCTNGASMATCEDQPAPALLSAAGRTCSCEDGFTYMSDAVGCADADACAAVPCTNGRGRASCTDLPAPALADAEGRTCSCNTGFTYTDDDSGCTDADACADDAAPCNDGADTAVCVDLPAPSLGDAAGRTCSCRSPGFVYANDDDGCVDADACGTYPCTNGAGTASCEDQPAPDALLNAAGRTCSCDDGFTYKNDTVGCVDVDACVAQPCANGNGTASCQDLPPPALDDADGRTCSCSAGFSYIDDDSGCTDIDACDTTPCTDGEDTAICVDRPAPALDDAAGRTCSCQAGFVYADETQGCVDVDACAAHPCTNGSGAASCEDLQAPALDNADGRTCSCNTAGFTYAGDTAGCVDCSVTGGCE